MRKIQWALCALMLVGTASIALAQEVSAEGHFRPGQDPKGFVIGSKPPAPTAAGPRLKGLPDPYREDDNWAKLPAGRIQGGSSGIVMDRDGKSVWTVDRCATESMGCALADHRNIDPVMKFDEKGNLLKAWGHGLFRFPHSIWVDQDNNVWIADGKAGQAKADDVGNTVRKFTQDGKLLLTLGKEHVVGDGKDPYVYRGPSAITTDTNGDIYVADGHDPKGPNRVIVYDKTGKFLRQFGQQGTGPEDFNPAHGLGFDDAGNLYVANRGNNLVQVFTKQGKFLHAYDNFGIANGLAVKNGYIYTTDHNFAEPKPTVGFGVAGIRIASVKNPGKLVANIPFGEDDTLEGIAVADDGTVYGSFTHKPGAHRWIPTGPLPK